MSVCLETTLTPDSPLPPDLVFGQGLGPITGLHDWLLALLRTSPFPIDELGHHPCLPPLVDHYAQTCITGQSTTPHTTFSPTPTLPAELVDHTARRPLPPIPSQPPAPLTSPLPA